VAEVLSCVCVPSTGIVHNLTSMHGGSNAARGLHSSPVCCGAVYCIPPTQVALFCLCWPLLCTSLRIDACLACGNPRMVM
jgi:hypothetical protein